MAGLPDAGQDRDHRADVDAAQRRFPTGGNVSDKPATELDLAMAGYAKASKDHRDAWERLDRAQRDHQRAVDADNDARAILREARARLDKALDVDGCAKETA
jgi:hypothetical protein